MQIYLDNKYPKQSFGMSIIHHPQDKRVEYYLKSLSPKVKTKINEIKDSNANNPIDIFLSIIKKLGKERLKVEVGHKTFTEGYFAKNPLKTIKKAVEFADKLNKEQTIQNELWGHKAPPYINLNKK